MSNFWEHDETSLMSFIYAGSTLCSRRRLTYYSNYIFENYYLRSKYCSCIFKYVIILVLNNIAYNH